MFATASPSTKRSFENPLTLSLKLGLHDAHHGGPTVLWFPGRCSACRWSSDRARSRECGGVYRRGYLVASDKDVRKSSVASPPAPLMITAMDATFSRRRSTS